MSSYSIPLTGLQASSDLLNAISNNLANINTDGYKDQNLTFSDIFYQTGGINGAGDPIQTGLGVQTSGTDFDFTNGSLQATGVPSNMALQGNGFFVTQQNGVTDYTRSGDFTVNSQGQISTPGGALVMGYPAVGGQIQMGSALQPINVSQNTISPASPTTTFGMTTNLDANAAVGSNYSTPITMYDSLGNAQTLSVEFTKTGANSWGYSISVPSSSVGGTGTSTQVSSGTLNFDANGNLTSPTGSVTGITVSGLSDGAASMNLTWNLNDASGSPTITQAASGNTTTATNQNGYASGNLQSYHIESDGTVEGSFSNGQTVALGQVAVASFANPQGLAATGNNSFQATLGSGAATVGTAGTGGRGAITGGSVEQSNVDVATEFAKMIVAQRGYEANAKVVTTFDQLDQTTMQMKS